MSNKVQLDAPVIGVKEMRYVQRALSRGYVSTFGPYVAQFENKLASFLEADDAVAVQSGTAALHAVLQYLGLKPGDEVIVPALTFIATASPVVHTGATPVFADVDINTWNIDPIHVEKKITAATKAIICVHLYGNVCDMSRLQGIAKRRGIALIEDATESLGSRYRGRHTGTIGDFGCFSFNGNKIITTGGGGMVVCRVAKDAARIRQLVNHSRSTTDYVHSGIGFNYRMTNLEASLGLAQLERLEAFIRQKAKFREIYLKELNGPSFVWQKEYPGAASCFWMNAVLFQNESLRERFASVLTEKGLPYRRIFAPLSESVPFQYVDKETLPNTYSIYKRGLCLPSSMVNSSADVRRICRVLRGTL